MKNTVLIGMPGAGKSTVGVLLAKSLLCDFCDTDLIIQKETGKSLCEIIELEGAGGFLKKENEIIASLEAENCVIATGGSAVYGEQAMKKLKENGIVVFLKVDLNELSGRLSNIKTRGVAMEEDMTLEELLKERLPYYERYADISVDCTDKTAEQCVELIIKKCDSLI